jgi:hypothetical protein
MASPAVKAAADASRHRSAQVQTGETRLRMLRADCAFFASEVLGIEIGDHHQEWSELVRKHNKISILAARGHGKSGFWSYAYPIWQSWRTPGNLGLIVSDTEGQVGEFFRIVKDGKEFRDPDGYLWKLPAMADVPFLVEAGMLPKDWERSWTESRIFFGNKSRFEGKTFGKRFRGRHVRWMVIDDGIGDDTQYSELAREKDWAFLTRTLSPMLLPGGQMIDAGTPLHADDIHGRLGKNAEYVQKKYPAIITESGRERALWPELRPMAWLRNKEREIGSLAFGQEYLLVPATSEASLFPLKLFSKHPETLAHGLCVGMTVQDIADRGWSVFFGVDVAQSAEVGADYFVICVMAVDPSGTRYIIDLFREKGLPFHQQLSTLEDWAVRYEPDMIYIEANASQRIYGDEMIRKTDLPIAKFVTSAGGKNSLDTGVLGLRPLIENGKFRLARGNAESIQKTDVLIAELGAFAWVDGKLQGVGAHDDTVMSCVAPGHRVTTQRGWLRIEDVVVGDMVLTHLGRWRRVTSIMQRHHRGEILTLHPSGSPSLQITGEHPVWAAGSRHRTEDGTNLVIPTAWDFVAADSLRSGKRNKGHFVLAPVEPAEHANHVVDLAAFAITTQRTRDCGGPAWKVSGSHVWWRRDRMMPRWLDVSAPDVAFLIGLYLAEGATGGGGAKSRKHATCFALHKRETYIAEFIEEQAARLFCAKVSKVVTGNGMTVAINSAIATSFFRMFGVHAGKHLPISMPQPAKMWVVRGWLVGDGSMSTSASAMRGLSIASEWIRQAANTLRAGGIRCSLRRTLSQHEEVPAWTIRLASTEAAKLMPEMNAVETQRWHSFRRETKLGNVSQVVTDQGHALKMRLIERAPYDGIVHNLHVEEDESYVVEGIAVHNCWIADQAVRASRRFTLWTATEDEEGEGVDEADDDPYAEQPAAVDEDADFVDLPDEDESPAPPPPPAPRPPAPKPGAPRLAAPVPQRPYDPDADELYDEPPAPKPRRAPPRTARSALAQLGQGHVDAQLATVADDLPDERQIWIEGWNAMMTGSEMPGPVARALKTHGHAPVRALLAKLLGV